MALDVRYDEIRSEVIGKLIEQKIQMEEGLSKLQRIVDQIPEYMEGEAAQAYVIEFEEIVKRIYSKLNINVDNFANQLESVCQEFENLDNDIQGSLTNS